jgi:signal transduction histidine kinase
MGMITVYFLYGLSFFAMSLAVGLESRRASTLPLRPQLPWLAAFGLTHSLVEWADMFRLMQPNGPAAAGLLAVHTLLLPFSAVLLVRFGIGLVREAGPLPNWLNLLPVVVIVPGALLVTYGLVIAITEPPLGLQADIWSRYLLYFPGCLLAAFGFVRQWLALRRARLSRARNLMLGAALAFVLNAIMAGLVVPASAHGLTAWLSAEQWLAWTGVPVELGRLAAALLVTFFVVRALDVFEGERAQQFAELQAKREQGQQAALLAHSEARQTAEDWTSGLVSISRRIATLEDVDHVLAAIADLARQLLRADTALVALWNEDHTRLSLKCCATAARTTTGDSLAVTNPVILHALEVGEACRYPDDIRPPVPGWFCPALQAQLQAAAIVPLLLEGQVIGGMWIGRRECQPISATSLVNLEHLADQVVIAIQYGLMAAQMQSLAVTEERSRIAREMHDGLAQILGYLSLELQTLETLVRRSDREAALKALKQARERIRAAHADVRENIVSLRTTLAGELGLLPALQQYVDEFGVQAGIEARLTGDVAAAPRLSPLAEVQLVRVIQEALTNVRKHAQAGEVEVRVTACDHALQVQVIDDGHGFEQSDSGRGHFGLQTMRERIVNVGGSLNVESHLGTGTRVEISVPLI